MKTLHIKNKKHTEYAERQNQFGIKPCCSVKSTYSVCKNYFNDSQIIPDESIASIFFLACFVFFQQFILNICRNQFIAGEFHGK